MCVCLHLHASWRSCPTGCVWAALAADSSPDLEVSSLAAQTHSNLWNTRFQSSEREEERREEEKRGEERNGKEKERREIWWTLLSEFFQHLYKLHRSFKNVILSAHTYLILPWDGNTACSKFGVEVVVSLVQIYSLDCGELLNVQNILTVHCPRLREGNDHGKTGVRGKTADKFILTDNSSSWKFTWKDTFFLQWRFRSILVSVMIKTKYPHRRTCFCSGTDLRTHRAQPNTLLTSGTKGGSTIPASSLLKLMFLKNEWALTHAAPSAWHPSLCFGSLVSSWVSSSSRDESSSYSSAHRPSLHTHMTPIKMLTILQMALVSSVNLSLYSSSSSCTLLSTSSRFTRSLRARKGDRPAVIS